MNLCIQEIAEEKIISVKKKKILTFNPLQIIS